MADDARTPHGAPGLGLVPRLMLGAVRGYRVALKPWLGNACRFEPTCSAYALGAIGRHGAWRGGALVAGRLLRCHPLCAGGLDPVPEVFAPPGRGWLTGRTRAAPPVVRNPSAPATEAPAATPVACAARSDHCDSRVACVPPGSSSVPSVSRASPRRDP